MNSNWSFLSTTLIIIQMIILFSKLTSASISPAEGLYCISDCETCPVICAPPPPPLKASSPPSPVKPPPVHDHSSPPDQSYYFESPPPPTKSSSAPTKAFPPPSYITRGQSPTSPPPPPPSPDLNSVPVPGGQGTFPSYTGQKNSSNPNYYYFYASEGSFLTLDLSFFLMVLLFSHALVVWCC